MVPCLLNDPIVKVCNCRRRRGSLLVSGSVAVIVRYERLWERFEVLWRWPFPGEPEKEVNKYSEFMLAK